MEASSRKKFQILFLIIVLILLARIGFIWKERRDAAVETKAAPAAQPISSDAYVVPPKLHAYDLASAKQGLEGKTIWVAAAGQIEYFPVHGNAIDWKHPIGTLPALDALHIQKVEKAEGPVELIKQGDVVFHKSESRIAAVFQHDNTHTNYAINIATSSDGSYHFIVDDAFFLEDPHQLYKNWSPEIWQAIADHQALKGMNELQASLALGPGKAEAGSTSGADYGNRTLQYDVQGKTFTVTFSRDRATDIQTK